MKEDKRYAEYWMGTHVNGPSKLYKDKSLKIETLLNTNLKYLFKVLSIEDPLSIQAHPDKKFAEVLHSKDKEHYKDDNHKPEMAIVISETFSLFYGLLPLKEALSLVEEFKFEDLNKIKFGEISKKFKNEATMEKYKELIVEIINLSDEDIQEIINKIKESIKDERLNKLFKDKVTTLNLLFNKFGEKDKGIIFSMFMNYYLLKFGDALFIRPNLPHAYIYGDCMELMANSDNVIRLGLTPKFVDTNSFNIVINKNKNIFKDFRKSVQRFNSRDST